MRTYLLLFAFLVLASCSESPASRIEFSQAASAPAYPSKDGGSGAAFSNILEVFGPEPVTITALRPLVDEGLRVRYLGMCRPGCPGAVGVEEGTRTVRQNFVGRLPIRLVPGSRTIRLAFSLEPDGASGSDALRADCLRFRALEVTLEDGTKQIVRYCCAPYINALRPDGQSGCRARSA